MLTDSITENLDQAKSKVDWEKVIEKGERVTVNSYISSIVKDI